MSETSIIYEYHDKSTDNPLNEVFRFEIEPPPSVLLPGQTIELPVARNATSGFGDAPCFAYVGTGQIKNELKMLPEGDYSFLVPTPSSEEISIQAYVYLRGTLPEFGVTWVYKVASD